MELIDRDALHQTYMRWFKKESVNNQTVTKSITLADALMKNEPVIEAIPVDWIIEWEKREENYYLYKDMVRFMIDDWRKEHETN